MCQKLLFIIIITIVNIVFVVVVNSFAENAWTGIRLHRKFSQLFVRLTFAIERISVHHSVLLFQRLSVCPRYHCTEYAPQEYHFLCKQVLWSGMFVGWLVGSFVHYARRYDFSKSESLIFMKLATDVQRPCQISLLTSERSRSVFKVICFENDPLAMSMAKCKYWPPIVVPVYWPKVGYVNHRSGTFGFLVELVSTTTLFFFKFVCNCNGDN